MVKLGKNSLFDWEVSSKASKNRIKNAFKHLYRKNIKRPSWSFNSDFFPETFPVT